MYRKTLLSLSIALMLPCAAQALSFAEAVDVLHQNSNVIKMQSYEKIYREKQSEAAKSLSGPKITASIQEIQGNKSLDLNLNLRPLVPIPVHIDKDYDISGPRASIDAIWPIYTGGAISAKQNALAYQALEAQAELDAQIQATDVELVKRYFGLQLARSVENLRREVFEQTARDYNRAKSFEKNGMGTHLETLNAQVSRDTAKRALTEARTDLSVAKLELKSLLQIEDVEKLTTPMTVFKNVGTLSAWKNLSLMQNPKIHAVDAKEVQAREGVRAAKAAYHPKVYLFGRYNFIKHYLTLPEPDWIAGLGVSFTIWDNRDRSASLYASEAMADKARTAGREVRRQIENAAQTTYEKLLQAQESHRLAKSTVSLARENLRLRTKAYEEGLAKIDDVNTARNKYVGARLGEEVAAYEFVVTYAYLHAISGNMTDFTAIYSSASPKK